MARNTLLMILITVSIFSGCATGKERAGTAAVSATDQTISLVDQPGQDAEAASSNYADNQTVTRIGVVDIVEVLRKTRIGQPVLARWQREFEEATRTEQQYLIQFHKPREYSSSFANPWFMAYRNAVNAIMPKVETVTKVLAQEHGFAIVLAKGNPAVMTTFYSANMLDLTDQVITELNRRFP